MGAPTTAYFSQELENIRARVMLMAGEVEAQLVNVIDGVLNNKPEKLRAVVSNDRDINALEIELEKTVHRFLSLSNPIAIDLRLVMMMSKMIGDLERIGDEAKKIAKKALRLDGARTAGLPIESITTTANITLEMLRRALDAFARLDTQAAAELARMDKEVNREYKSSLQEAINFSSQQPQYTEATVQFAFLSKSFESIGDLAKSIAQYVVYLVEARDVRHTKLTD